MSIELERPLLLLLLPLSLAAVYWLWRTSRAYMPPLRRRAALVVRLAVTSLIVLMLAVPSMQLYAREEPFTTQRDGVGHAYSGDVSSNTRPACDGGR